MRHLKLKTLKDLREVMQVVARVLDRFKSRSDPLQRPRCPVTGMATEIQGIVGPSWAEMAMLAPRGKAGLQGLAEVPRVSMSHCEQEGRNPDPGGDWPL